MANRIIVYISGGQVQGFVANGEIEMIVDEDYDGERQASLFPGEAGEKVMPEEFDKRWEEAIAAKELRRYTVPANTHESYKRWIGDWDNGPMALDAEMSRMMDVVAEALDKNLYYTKDVLAYVLQAFDFTDDELIRGSGKDPLARGGVEGGVIGMEAHYARERVEKNRRIAEEMENRKAFPLLPGQKLGSLRPSGPLGKELRNCVVVSLSEESVRLEYTQGRQRYQKSYPTKFLKRAWDEREQQKLAKKQSKPVQEGTLL